MNLKKFKEKKIIVLGLGIENLSFIKFLQKHKVNCRVTVADARRKSAISDKLKGLNEKYLDFKLGKGYDKDLSDYDIIVRSPGYPLASSALRQAFNAPTANEITSPMKLFFELCPTDRIIGVTGSKGKGTTSSLIAAIFERAGRKVFLGGNIGVAPFDFIDELTAKSWVVLELSSFQLEDMTTSPHIAVITNLMREHLSPADPNNPNYHKTMEDYREAKANIIKWQSKNDYAVINHKLKGQQWILGSGQKIYFDKSDLPSALPGEHNKENIAAAEAVAKLIGAPDSIIRSRVMSFEGLEHRLELAGDKNGIKYYNDSFATTPEAALTSLKSFDSPVVLIAGGADKGSDFRELAGYIKKKVDFVCLLDGKGTVDLKQALKKAGYRKYRVASSMQGAVREAKAKAREGGVVLLAPACASFGMFKNYKERGKQFKSAVKKIK